MGDNSAFNTLDKDFMFENANTQDSKRFSFAKGEKEKPTTRSESVERIILKVTWGTALSRKGSLFILR